MKKIATTWKSMKLGNVTSEINGGISVHASDRSASEGEHGILTLSAVSYGQFNPNANKALINGNANQLGPPVSANTVLISRSNTYDLVGRCVYVDKDYPQLHLPDLIWELSTDLTRIEPRWLHYCLSSPHCRAEIMRRATGTSGSMKKISMSSLRGIELSVPPFSEQQAIAEFISVWDKGIREATDLVTAKVGFKQGLMQQLLTGMRRFAEFRGNEWMEYQLGELFDERTENDRDDLPLLSITSERGIIPRDEVDRKDTSTDNKSRYKRIAPGDIGYNTMRMWQGVSAVSSLEGIVSPAYTICTPREQIDAQFAGYLFKYPPTVHLFYRYSQGMVSDTWNLKFHHFSEIRVRIPDINEQRKIASMLLSVDQEIGLLRDELDLLKRQKKGLMQKLLTGEVRVSSGHRRNSNE